jgi:hypothetical protein
LACIAPFYVSDLDQYFYQLQAVASCGSGEVSVEREVATQLKSSF